VAVLGIEDIGVLEEDAEAGLGQGFIAATDAGIKVPVISLASHIISAALSSASNAAWTHWEFVATHMK
jgi:hypothetical protein